MRRQRLLFLFTICAILVTMAILGSASWMIVKQHTETPAYPVKPDTSPYFTTEYTYDGSTTFVPELNEDGIAIFGEDAEFEITYVTGKTFEASYNSGTYNSLADAENAGDHYFKITEATTGQVIANYHLVTVNKANVTLSTAVSSVTNNGSANSNLASLSAGFIGDTVTWTISINGVSGDGVLGTASVSYELLASDFDTFSSSIQDSSNTGSIDYSVSANDVSNKKHKNNYTISGSGTVTCGVLPTCYSTDGTTKTYYGNLDQALEKTVNSTATVVAVPSLTVGSYSFAAIKNFNHEVTLNRTVGTNVTLSIPYNESVTDIIVHDSTIKSPIFNNSKYELNYVTISENVTLTNNGTINIPAVISGGKGGQISSFVGGNYSRIYMDDNSTISSTGTINCYGYITESTENNGSHVNVTAGTINTVFTVQENRGGSTFMGMVNPTASGLVSGIDPGVYEPTITTFPFNRFYVHSVTSLLTMSGNATLIGHTSMYADNKDNFDDMILIGSSAEALVQLGTNSKVKCKFQIDDTSTTIDERKNALDFYGDVTINSLSFGLSVTKSGITINVSLNSKSTFFPVSHYLDISFKKYENGSNATVTMTDQDIKVLPGGSITIDSGVTVNANQIAIYNSNKFLNMNTVSSTAYTPRNSVDAPSYTVTTPGILTVNGTLNVVNIGGEVKTNTSGAILNITDSGSVCSQELINTYSTTLTINAVVTTVTQTYNASIYSPVSESTLTASGLLYHYNDTGTGNIGTGNNVSTGTAWEGSSSRYEVKYEFYYTDENGVLTQLDANATSTYQQNMSPVLVVPDVTGYAFEAWYWNAACTEAIDTSSLTGSTMYSKSSSDDKSVTVYGKFKQVNENEVKINYVIDSSIVTDTNHIISATAQEISDKSVATTHTLQDLTGNNTDVAKMYYFDGWYLDANYTQAVANSTISLDTAENGSITVYGRWISKYQIVVNQSTSKSYSEFNYTIYTVAEDGTTTKISTSTCTFYIMPDVKVKIEAFAKGKLPLTFWEGYQNVDLEITTTGSGAATTDTTAGSNDTRNGITLTPTFVISGDVTFTISVVGV